MYDTFVAPLEPVTDYRTRVRYLPSTSVVDPHHFDTDADADPDSTYHPDADPDADFYSMLIWMRMRIQLFTLMRIRTQILNNGVNPRKRAKICSYYIHFGSSSSN